MLQKENLDLQTQNFELEKKHSKEMIQLQNKYSKLEEKVKKSQSVNIMAIVPDHEKHLIKK